jgi:hypothetical protein
MKPSLQAGVGSVSCTVERERTIDRMGEMARLDAQAQKAGRA